MNNFLQDHGELATACGICLRSTYRASATTKFIPSHFTSTLCEIALEQNMLSVHMKLQLFETYLCYLLLLRNSNDQGPIRRESDLLLEGIDR